MQFMDHLMDKYFDRVGNKSSKIKANLPDLFHGTKRGPEAMQWILNLGSYFALRPNEFQDDRQRVIFASGFLRGTAGRWAAPFLQDALSMTGPVFPETDDIQLWQQAFLRMFGDPDVAARATRDLLKLKQVRSAADYASEFTAIAVDVPWNNLALRDHFRRGLKSEVKDELARDELPPTLEDLMDKAIRIDDRLYTRRMEKAAETAHTSKAPIRNPPPKPQSRNPFLPQIAAVEQAKPKGADSMTKEQRRKHRMEKGLCLYCGEQGHLVAKCPTAPKRTDLKAEGEQAEKTEGLEGFQASDS